MHSFVFLPQNLNFQEIAALGNISNHDFEQYANLIGLNQICKKNWASSPWPPTHHLPSDSSTPEIDSAEHIVLKDGSEMIDPNDPNFLMALDQPGYQTQFTTEQLQFISQLHVSYR